MKWTKIDNKFVPNHDDGTPAGPGIMDGTVIPNFAEERSHADRENDAGNRWSRLGEGFHPFQN